MLKVLIPQHLYQSASIFGLVKHFIILILILRTVQTAPQPVLCLTPPGTWQDTTKHLLNKLNFHIATVTRQTHWLVSSQVIRKMFLRRGLPMIVLSGSHLGDLVNMQILVQCGWAQPRNPHF